MANNRIYYAIQQIGFEPLVSGPTKVSHGVQSVGMTTNFDLAQVFALGQLAIYENIEEIPNVEVTASKVLDGYPLLYTDATIDATNPTVAGRQTARSNFYMSIFDEADILATGTADSMVQCSGMYISSVTYIK